MDETNEGNGNCIKSWETYKILNKIKENVQQKRRIAKDVLVLICLFVIISMYIELVSFLNSHKQSCTTKCGCTW